MVGLRNFLTDLALEAVPEAVVASAEHQPRAAAELAVCKAAAP